MENLFYAILIVHIIAGTTSLLSGLGAIIFRNKVKTHRPFGKIYFWSMTVIFVSAIYMSIAHSYYSCLTAFRSLKLKKLHLDQNPSKIDWAIEAFFGLMNVGFVVFAILLLMGPNKNFGIISLVFGLVGVRGNYITIMRLRKKLEYKNYWLLAHIGGMLGSYIGAITAFVVNNSRVIPLPNIILWLGPTALFVPLIVFELKKHKKKAGKFVTT
jgi:uncharacterized membrane protein HdeD (DUF308 family)